MKRVFGWVEVVFDILYLIIATGIACYMFFFGELNINRILAAIIALILVDGDAFHLIPRIRVILTQDELRFRKYLGLGKMITSITMTLFYVFLWHLFLNVYNPSNISIWTYIIYILSLIRIILCLLPQNKWDLRYPPVEWGIYRNIPFFLIGLINSIFFFMYRDLVPGLSWMWLAILLSFGFYLPVVLWSNMNPKIGMLMLPKTSVYVWMLWMFLSL